MSLKFRNIEDLKDLMTEEQRFTAQQNYEKFFGKPFGGKQEICIVDLDCNDEDFLKTVDLKDFD